MPGSKIKTRCGNDRGATVVEFAILVPIFLTIIFGFLEFGVIFYEKHNVSNAARDGVRVGIRANNYECFNGPCEAAKDRKAAAEKAVKEKISGLWDTDTEVTLEITPVPNNLTSPQKELVVTVTAPNFMPALVSIFVPGFESPPTITHTARAQYEDPTEP